MFFFLGEIFLHLLEKIFSFTSQKRKTPKYPLELLGQISGEIFGPFRTCVV